MAGVVWMLLANGEHGEGFEWYSLIEPLGIATLVLIVSTLSVGLFIKKNRRVLLPLHRTLAFLTLAAGLAHAIVVHLL